MLRSRKYSIQPTTNTTPNHKKNDRMKCLSTGGLSATSIGWVGPITLRRRARPELENERHRDISLYLSVQEVKNLSNRGRYFCEICLDRIPYARTTSRSSDSTVFWGENFDLNNLPEISVLTVNLYKQREFFKEKRYRSKTQNQFIAFVTVPLTHWTPQDAVRAQWFPMQPPQAIAKAAVVPNRTNSTDSSSPVSPPTSTSSPADSGKQRDLASPGSTRFRKRSTPVSCFRSPGASAAAVDPAKEAAGDATGKKTAWAASFSMDSSFRQQNGATSGTASPKSPKTSNATAFPFHNQSLPQIRLQISYAVTDVLPMYYYDGLHKFIATNYRNLVRCLEPGLSAKQKEALAGCLVHIFEKLPDLNVFQLLADMLEDELIKNSDPALIFRSNSVGSKAMECYMKLVGSEYLHQLLKPYIDQLLASDDDFELDPTRIANTSESNGNSAISQAGRNLNALLVSLRSIWQRIQLSDDYLPTELRTTFNTLGEITRRYCNPEAATRLTSSFFFLRFVCPAIHGPVLYGLVTAAPESARISRNLTLVAKVLQNLANLTLFGEKELHMESVNVFVESELSNMCQFLHQITSLRGTKGQEHQCTIPEHHRFIDTGYEFARLSKILTVYEEQFTDELSDLTYILRLVEHHTQATLAPDWPPCSNSNITTSAVHVIDRRGSNNKTGKADSSMPPVKPALSSNNWRANSVQDNSYEPENSNPRMEMVEHSQPHTQHGTSALPQPSYQSPNSAIQSTCPPKALSQPYHQGGSDQTSLSNQSSKKSAESSTDCHHYRPLDAEGTVPTKSERQPTTKDSKGCQTESGTDSMSISNSYLNNRNIHRNDDVNGLVEHRANKSVGSVYEVGESVDGYEEDAGPIHMSGVIKGATSDNALSRPRHQLEESPSLDQLAERMQEMKLILQQKRQEAEKTAACRVQAIRNREESLERMVNHVDQLRQSAHNRRDYSEVGDQQQQGLTVNAAGTPRTTSPSSSSFSSSYGCPDLPPLSTSSIEPTNDDPRSVAARRQHFSRYVTMPEHAGGTSVHVDGNHYRSHSFRARDWSERQPPVDRIKAPTTSSAEPMAKYGGLNLLDLSLASEGTGIPLGKLIMANNSATTALSSCYQRRYPESKYVEN